ncbi:MAG TPA: hypothetical protein VJY54_10160 [Lachnospiraceae bacterium]|nr:hypothetical protein [Lachnospiraceae bacterium]
MKKMTVKRVAAWIAIVLLVGLYLVTLVLALLNSPATNNLFKVSLVCTILVPVMCWIFIWIYGQLTGKKTIADLNLMQDKDKVAEQDEKLQ